MAQIGDLVANLTVNSAGWGAGLQKAHSDLGGFAKSIGSHLASIGGALGVGLGAIHSLEAAREDLQAMQSLTAVLDSTGKSATVSAKEIGVLASSLQRVTNYADEATVGAAAIIATLKNLDASGLKRAIPLAQDMATVLKIDLDGAAKKLIKTMKELTPDQAIKKLSELESQFGGAAKAVADPLTQLKNLVSDIGEEIGRVLNVALKPLQQLVIPFLADWGTNLGRVAVAIGVTTVAMKAVVAVQKSIATGQALIQAIAGPAGWANLAIGAAVFTTAMIGINAAMGSVGDTADVTTGKVAKFSTAYKNYAQNTPEWDFFLKVAPTVDELGKLQKDWNTQLEKSKKFVSELAVPAELRGIKDETQKIANAFGTLSQDIMGAEGAAEKLKELNISKSLAITDAIERMSGFKDKLKEVSDEIAVLSGKSTEAAQELKKMAQAGVSPEKIRQLELAINNRDVLKAAQEQGKKLNDEAHAIADAVKTPQEKLKADAAKVEDLFAKGLLSREEANRALEQSHDKFKQAQEGKHSESGNMAVGALQHGSSEAASAVIRAISSKNANDIPAKQLATLQEVAGILDATNTYLDKIEKAGVVFDRGPEI